MANRENKRMHKHGSGDTQSRVGEQPGRSDAGVAGGQQGGLGGRREGSRDDADAQRIEDVQDGVNRELGDMDAEADPNRDPKDDDDGLPGKMGGGLMGG
jgi:hypothetical protein